MGAGRETEDRAGPEGATVGGPPPGLLVLTGAAVVAAAVLTALLVPWTAAPQVLDPAGGLPPGQVARAEAVAAALRLPALLSQAAGLVAVALVVLARPGRRLLDRVAGVPGGPVVRVVAQVLLLLAVVLVVRWPSGVWAEVVRRREGLSVRGWDVFARDRLVAAGLDALVLCAVVVAVVLLARRLPRWWPAAVAGAGAVTVVVLSLLYPVLVEPLFARLEPLPAGEVRTQVEEVAAEAGAPVRDVLVADTSTRATTLNAYVSGLGPTRRVVLQDTLLAAMTPSQVLAVVAHETAHAASGDVVRGTVVGAAGVAAGALLLGCAALGVSSRRAGGRSSPRPGTGPGTGARGGADGPRDAGGRAGSQRTTSVGLSRAAAPVLLVLLVAQVLVVPAEALVSRQIERAADARALDLTGDPVAFAEAMQVLAVTNRADPSPPAWVQWWFGSHPTVAERVAVAAAWPEG